MLPDLPRVKSKLDDAYMAHFHRKVSECLGVFGEAPRHTVHEGECMEIFRADGTQDTTEFKPAQAEWSIEKKDIPTMTTAARLAKIEQAAEEMARQISKGLFESLDTGLQKAGRTIQGTGRGFDLEEVFRGLDAIEWNFRADGTAEEISIVVPPALRDRAKQALEELKGNPDVQARYKALIDKKRMAWREREAARKLVG